jgi:hypothetical protein
MQQAFNPTQLDSYNKHPGRAHGTMIANWFEENVLREKDGEGRTKHNFHYPKSHHKLMNSEPEEVQAMVGGRTFENTKLRTIGFNDYPPMKTENHEYGTGHNKADAIPKVGARQQLLEKQFLGTVSSQLSRTQRLEEEALQQRQFATTYSELMQDPGLPREFLGRRRMVNQDGTAIPFAMKDEELLTSFGFYERRQITDDATLRAMLPKDEPYSKQQPVSFWLEKLPEGNLYNSRAPARKREFNRNNEFVKGYAHFTNEKL